MEGSEECGNIETSHKAPNLKIPNPKVEIRHFGFWNFHFGILKNYGSTPYGIKTSWSLR